MQKETSLLAQLSTYGEVIVAYSGGVDSAYLAYCAHKALGDKATAVTARSASLSQRELQAASRLAHEMGITHEVIDTGELDRPEYVANSTTRCYFCKDTLFAAVDAIATKSTGRVVVDGFNADDVKDYRPGHRAAREHGVLHPLAQVGLTKAEIRALSKQKGLMTWNKPQLACLSSRVPYGMAVTEPRLAKIEAMEDALRVLGFEQLRARLVRGNDDMLRLEVGADELAQVVAQRQTVIRAAHEAGFRFVTLDLEGFRSGRLNEGVVDQGGRLPVLA